MIEETYRRIAVDPKFASFVKKRNNFSLLLSAIVLLVYYAFVLFASLAPAQFGTSIGNGSAWCSGLLIGWGIQAFAFLMTGVYVFRANSEFDGLNRSILKDASE